MLKQYIASSPTSCGVYKMLGSQKEILYVGKAKNLRLRLGSYLKPLSNRLQQLLLNIASVEIIPTKNEEEALLLELTLIKKFQPKYNILLKDDKSFPYIMLNEHHDFPRVSRYRGYKNDQDTYFGPFTSPNKVTQIISALQKAFLLRSCSDKTFKTIKEPCILYQLKRCSAPCVGKIEKSDYAKLVQQAKDFLSGADHALKQTLTKQMVDASTDMNYEAAAIYRDRIKALSIVNKTLKRDTLAPGKYANRLYELQKFLNLPDLNRVEIYDNSHTQGSNAVGVMVVFDKNGFNKSEYRTYNIKFNADYKSTSNDYYMMEEMLTRRLMKLATKPELIIIDGGVGHVSTAVQVCTELGIENICIIGIAKGIDRNAGNENIYTSKGDKIVLDQHDKLKYFMQTLRDEAHRFAITSHRNKRSKAMLKSALDGIAGIGKKRKNDLLKHFGSPQNIKNAPIEELIKIKGITRQLAEIIRQSPI